MSVLSVCICLLAFCFFVINTFWNLVDFWLILNPTYKYCTSLFLHFIYLFIYLFLGPHLWHVEVPRLGVKLELQLQAYTIVTPDPSHICDLHHSCGITRSLTHWARPGIKPASSQRQRKALNPLSHNSNSIKRFWNQT